MQRKPKRAVKRSAPPISGALPHYDLSEPDHEELSKENLAEIGGQRIQHELEEHNSTSPALTGGDLDADWQGAEGVGDEAVGGHAPTPDQNVVDEIGQALGFDEEEGEELHSLEELAAERDRNRWELDHRSVEGSETDRS